MTTWPSVNCSPHKTTRETLRNDFKKVDSFLTILFRFDSLLSFRRLSTFFFLERVTSTAVKRCKRLVTGLTSSRTTQGLTCDFSLALKQLPTWDQDRTCMNTLKCNRATYWATEITASRTRWRNHGGLPARNVCHVSRPCTPQATSVRGTGLSPPSSGPEPTNGRA